MINTYLLKRSIYVLIHGIRLLLKCNMWLIILKATDLMLKIATKNKVLNTLNFQYYKLLFTFMWGVVYFRIFSYLHLNILKKENIDHFYDCLWPNLVFTVA